MEAERGRARQRKLFRLLFRVSNPRARLGMNELLGPVNVSFRPAHSRLLAGSGIRLCTLDMIGEVACRQTSTSSSAVFHPAYSQYWVAVVTMHSIK
jgi:hypothetical protein